MMSAAAQSRSLRGVFDMNCLLSSSWISIWGPDKNKYIPEKDYSIPIQYLQNGV